MCKTICKQDYIYAEGACDDQITDSTHRRPLVDYYQDSRVVLHVRRVDILESTSALRVTPVDHCSSCHGRGTGILPLRNFMLGMSHRSWP